MPDANSVALANYRACCAALAMIREVVEELAPPGRVRNAEDIGPDSMEEADALIRGIYAIAGLTPT